MPRAACSMLIPWPRAVATSEIPMHTDLLVAEVTERCVESPEDADPCSTVTTSISKRVTSLAIVLTRGLVSFIFFSV